MNIFKIRKAWVKGYCTTIGVREGVAEDCKIKVLKNGKVMVKLSDKYDPRFFSIIDKDKYWWFDE